LKIIIGKIIKNTLKQITFIIKRLIILNKGDDETLDRFIFWKWGITFKK